MVFKKKPKPEPEQQDNPPVYAGSIKQQQEPLQEAIGEFNNTYAGVFEGDLATTNALLFAIYAELRQIRKEE